MLSVIDESGYGRCGDYSRVMERFFHLDDEDRRLIRTVPIDPLPRYRRLIPESARREGSSREVVVSDVTADKGSLCAVIP